jgi:hypothetical protein
MENTQQQPETAQQEEDRTVEVRITRSAQLNDVPVSVNGVQRTVPVDGKFHPIPASLLGALEDADVDFEKRELGEDAGERRQGDEPSDESPATDQGEQSPEELPAAEQAPAGDADGLGGSAASPTSDEAEQPETADSGAGGEADQIDNNGDGHDDRDGTFVDGNQEARGGASEQEQPL